jgi:hypothetical protein
MSFQPFRKLPRNIDPFGHQSRVMRKLKLANLCHSASGGRLLEAILRLNDPVYTHPIQILRQLKIYSYPVAKI